MVWFLNYSHFLKCLYHCFLSEVSSRSKEKCGFFTYLVVTLSLWTPGPHGPTGLCVNGGIANTLCDCGNGEKTQKCVWHLPPLRACMGLLLKSQFHSSLSSETNATLSWLLQTYIVSKSYHAWPSILYFKNCFDFSRYINFHINLEVTINCYKEV